MLLNYSAVQSTEKVKVFSFWEVGGGGTGFDWILEVRGCGTT